MPDAPSPDAIVVEDDDRFGGHAPRDAMATPEELAAFEAASVDDGEEPTKRGGVILPPIRVLSSPNCSSRRGQTVRGIVIHETQGGYHGAVGWLMRTGVQASAHIVLNEDGSEATQIVPWSMKAWHAVGANSYSLGLELAGFESTPNQKSQIARAARICGYWCDRFNIPPVRERRAWNGIATHEDLGAFGGGHHDPGGFDVDAFIAQVAAEVKRGRFRRQWGRD